MTDPIADILGDYRAFFAGQKERLRARGIDISPYPLSHLAYRVHEWDRYLQVRDQLERHAVANVENIWNGRPISKILLREPLRGGTAGHRRPDRVDPAAPPARLQDGARARRGRGRRWGRRVRPDPSGGPHRPAVPVEDFEPYYILFEDFTHVKFYPYSLRTASERQGHASFDGFVHVDDWVPTLVRTATGGTDPRRAPKT